MHISGAKHAMEAMEKRRAYSPEYIIAPIIWLLGRAMPRVGCRKYKKGEIMLVACVSIKILKPMNPCTTVNSNHESKHRACVLPLTEHDAMSKFPTPPYLYKLRVPFFCLYRSYRRTSILATHNNELMHHQKIYLTFDINTTISSIYIWNHHLQSFLIILVPNISITWGTAAKYRADHLWCNSSIPTKPFMSWHPAWRTYHQQSRTSLDSIHTPTMAIRLSGQWSRSSLSPPSSLSYVWPQGIWLVLVTG